MAFVGDTPWHQIGSRLPARQPIEVWAECAGMSWQIEQAPVRYDAGDDRCTFDEQKVLYRSDNLAALSVVGKNYQVVQPMEVLEFYRDLTERAGFELETAGVLKGGRKFWALARTGRSVTLKGVDVVDGYLLLATSCDGTLATTATATSVRVVCNNTLGAALRGSNGAIKVPHRTAFEPATVKRQLGLVTLQWDAFMVRMRAMAERRVMGSEVNRFFEQLLRPADQGNVPRGAPNDRALKRMLALFEGQGIGSELAAAKGTAWGLLNAVTQFVDYERRSFSPEYRLDSAWFGAGAALKQRALDQAVMLSS
jgi:phage/plasmid-like protein (TIGR03299 family)